MANEIREKLDGYVALTISLASLGINLGRSSSLVTNLTGRRAAKVNLRISPATAPTAGTVYELFMLLTNGTATQGTDLWGEADAAFTPVNALLIGTLVNPGSTTDVEDIFDTAPLGILGEDWGIAVRNSTNQIIDATGTNHITEQNMYLEEIQ